MSWSESDSHSTACAPQAAEKAYGLSFKKPMTQIGKQDLHREEYKKVNKIGLMCQRNSRAREIVADGHKGLKEARTGIEPNRMKTI